MTSDELLTTKDFFYTIPQELIAQSPSESRTESRILVCNSQNKTIEDNYFFNLSNIICEKFSLKEKKAKVLLITNDTRVYPARVRIQRKTGARGEVFILNRTPDTEQSYECLLRPLSKLHKNELLYADKHPVFKVHSTDPPKVSLVENISLDSVLEKYGEMPLPPYIVRDPLKISNPNINDKERYQTVYSNVNKVGSAAAPTAGLHFDLKTMEECEKNGIEFASVTLHVGLGTFAPVQVDVPSEHSMHEEHYCLDKKTYEKINEFAKNNWPIIYVGTTSLRAVESFFRNCKEQDVDIWHTTKLFLHPVHKKDRIRPRVGNAIITNFHLPESTLCMLVAALMGYDFWKEFYSHAIDKKYRFFSYGDSSLLIFN